MSRQKSRTDLLVRVRYQNPLPPPPFPPKLINVPTSLDRITSYEFLEPLCSEREMPMIVDSELGMPMELGKIRQGDYGDGEYWMGDRSKIAPSKSSAPTVVPDEDAWMLGDTSSMTSAAPGMMPNSSSTYAFSDRKKADVSWLRKTEYMAAEVSRPSTSALAAAAIQQKAQTPSHMQALSREGRIKAIQATFAAANAPLETLKHPTKPHLTAETSWPVLPDAYLWSNSASLTRFGEDPAEGRLAPQTSAQDPRLPRAIFRPLQVPGADNRIGYYLIPEDDLAVQYESRRRATDDVQVAQSQEDGFEFRHVRDYEIANSRELLNEYIFCFDDGESASTEEPSDKPGQRRRGVYYSKLHQMDVLRKRRLKRGERVDQFPREAEEEGVQFWHGIVVTVKPTSEDPDDVREEREYLRDEVTKVPAHDIPSEQQVA